MLEYEICKLELQKFDTNETISSAQGILCGYACVKSDITLNLWLNEIINQLDSKKDSAILANIFNDTIEQMNDSTLNFNLLIADDDNLSEQALSIVDWCNGFLLGLGLAQTSVADKEVLEIIKDISNIAKLEIDLINNNENANDLVEIIEFMRMSVLLIQEILNSSKQDFVNPNKLH